MKSQQSDHENIFQQALTLYNKGDYAASLPYCQEIIAHFPRDFNTLQLIGVNYYQLNDSSNAIVWLEKARSIDDTKPQLLNSLACAYRDTGAHTKAIETYSQAIRNAPNYLNAILNLGLLYTQLGKHGEALPLLCQASDYKPDDLELKLKIAESHALQGEFEQADQFINSLKKHTSLSRQIDSTLAKIAFHKEDWQQAADIYRQQLDDDPNNASAWNNLGSVWEKQENWTEAKECYSKAIETNPQLALAYGNLSRIHLLLDDIDSAIQAGNQALTIAPKLVSVSLTLSDAAKTRGDVTAAESFLIAALEKDSHFGSAWFNLANLYRETGRFAEAIECYENALLIDPEHADAELNLGLALLTTGQFENGWKHYFKRPRFLRAGTTLSTIVPGTPFNHKHILLLRAQGIGDELLFLRFAQRLKEQGASITYQASNKLAPIIQNLNIIDRIITESEEPPQADYTFTIDDLPLLLDIKDAKQIPTAVQLQFNDTYAINIRTQLNTFGPGPYVAINWHGGAENKGKVNKHYNVLSKSIPLNEFANILDGINGTFVIAQRFPKPEELEFLNTRFPGRIIDMSSMNDDLEKMLALLAVIDSYIGVSNTDMHLLSSLGKTADVLIPFPADWRWLAQGDESPWMPGFRIHRQTMSGDWPIVKIKGQRNTNHTTLEPQSNMNTDLKLEFGCGDKQPKDGFVGVDIREYPHVKYICSAWEIDQHIEKNSVSEIYSRHFFEHLSFSQAEKTIQAWNTILCHGGKIEMIVPNMLYHIYQWLDPDRKNKLVPGNSGLTLEEHAKRGFWGHQREGFEKIWDLHKSGYDWPLLFDFLTDNGFVDIQQIDGMPKNLHVVAYKP